MRSLYAVIFSLLLTGVVFAQEADSTISVQSGRDSLYVFFKPAFHLDYGKVLTLPLDFETKVEGGVSLLFFDRLELVGEFGYWDKPSNQAIVNGDYTSVGTYFRAGIGYLGRIQSVHRIGLGLRYGQSNFEEEGSFTIDATDLTDEFSQSFTRTNLTAQWWELVLTSASPLRLKSKVPNSPLNKIFQLGLQFRLRLLIESDRFSDPIDVYTIPGFGRNLSDYTVAVNFFLRIYPFGQ